MSRKNRVMEAKNRKVRICDARARKESALRHSVMELHFGDISLPKDGTANMYKVTEGKITKAMKVTEIDEKLKNSNLSISEHMALVRKRATLMG